ncbi:DsrE family protein [Qipengyuania sp. DSG2-2]|uniref:DsrE family protein n=1 Tax=Qipengyuania sp. DGS2-2 TaxID=3349631 RepID=UPI0036D3699D
MMRGVMMESGMLKAVIGFVVLTAATGALAQEPDMGRFSMGPVFEDYGPAAEVEATMPIPEGATFRVAMDAAKQADEGVNLTLFSASRLINMHAKARLPVDATQVAVVVHGKATLDLLTAEAYAARFDGAENPNVGLISALTDHGVRIILCGQSAAAQGVDETADLLPGVEVALSAMTAHALLQADGYTLNPF